jgi:hypothetical protein
MESPTEQVLLLAATELKRMESQNRAWLGAYSGMRLVDGDTTNHRLSGMYASRTTFARDFPKGYWIVYLQPAIPRLGRSTIMAFSKNSLTLVYFGAVND